MMVLTLLTSSGCATRFNETYYVGVMRKGSGQPLQFYRFRMKGCADCGTRTKFTSGWYPAEALQAVVGEFREGSEPSDPSDVLLRAAAQPLHTESEPLSIDFSDAENLKATVSGANFFMSRKQAISPETLKKITWSELTLSFTLIKEGEKDNKKDLDEDEFLIQIGDQFARIVADQAGLDALFLGDVGDVGDVEFRGGSLTLKGMTSIAAFDVDIDAELEKGGWDSTGGGSLKRLTAQAETYRWSIEGGTVTAKVARSEVRGRKLKRLVASVQNLHVANPETLVMSHGWRLLACHPIVTENTLSGLGFWMRGVVSYNAKRSDLSKWFSETFKTNADKPLALLANMTKRNQSRELKLEKAIKLKFPDTLKVKNAAESMVVRAGSFDGALTVSPKDKGTPPDFRLDFYHPVTPQGVTDPHGLEYFVIGPEGSRKALRDQRLVIFMASDPEPVTSAIQSFAQNSEVQASIASLVTNLRAREKTQHDDSRRTIVKTALMGLKALIDGIPDITAEDAEKQVTSQVQKLMIAASGAG